MEGPCDETVNKLTESVERYDEVLELMKWSIQSVL